MRLAFGFFWLALLSGELVAQEIKVTGLIDQVVRLPVQSTRLMGVAPIMKHITLLKVELSDTAKVTIDNRVSAALESANKVSVNKVTLPARRQLGMANVPVLDQGSHGTCVTFANTAAIDAAMNKGDYVSQLCLLQLGRYLENHAYNPSGWDGSWGSIVLNQLSVFGMVNKTEQMTHGCAGLTEYPQTEEPANTEMSPEEYHPISQSLAPEDISWSVILDSYQAAMDKVDMDTIITRVKEVINVGDRLTFGVLLPAVDKGLAGAIGKHHGMNDSWVLTPEIAQALQVETNLPGHEMIITGYDDDAVAFDDQGREHKGLLTLRNSWSRYVGDKGDFYMSYDYFKALVVELQQIRGPRA